MNAIVDCLGVYKTCVSARSGEMIAPNSLKHLPLYILSLLKQVRCMSSRLKLLSDWVKSTEDKS